MLEGGRAHIGNEKLLLEGVEFILEGVELILEMIALT